MLRYKEIKRDARFAAAIWSKENELPRWFRCASHCWTPDFESFKEFWSGCAEIYGLFDRSELVAVVYLELGELQHSVNIHISVIAKINNSDLIRFFRTLVLQKRADGITDFRAWIFKRNFSLREIAKRTGFRETGLAMSYGQSHGKVLNWLEFYQ